jgi:hypothetical protein
MEQVRGWLARFFYSGWVKRALSFLDLYGKRLQQIFRECGIDEPEVERGDDELFRKIINTEKELHFIYAIKKMIAEEEDIMMKLAGGSTTELQAIRRASCGDYVIKLKHYLDGIRQNNNQVGN